MEAGAGALGPRPAVRSERPRGVRKRIRNAPPGPPRMWPSSPDVEGRNSYGHLAQGKQAAHTRQSIYGESRESLPCVKGEVGSAMTIVSLPARGRPPPAGPALRRAEEVVTTGNNSADCLGVSMPSGQGRQRWNLGDLVLLKMLPEDGWRPVRLSAPGLSLDPPRVAGVSV